MGLRFNFKAFQDAQSKILLCTFAKALCIDFLSRFSWKMSCMLNNNLQLDEIKNMYKKVGI